MKITYNLKKILNKLLFLPLPYFLLIFVFDKKKILFPFWTTLFGITLFLLLAKLYKSRKSYIYRIINDEQLEINAGLRKKQFIQLSDVASILPHKTYFSLKFKNGKMRRLPLDDISGEDKEMMIRRISAIVIKDPVKS